MKQKTTVNIRETGIRTIRLESSAIGSLEQYINADFERVVELMAACTGRVVITGIGKSAIIAQKIVATFNSTGTPALFMHAADAIHGDLGMITQDDVVVVISKSGESPEIKVLVPLVRNLGNVLVAIVGKADSYLAQSAHFVLNTYVSQEACPNNLAPTSSTTAQMVMGDALAVCLIEMKGFTAEDFARFHPGGTLGKKLYLKVGDLRRMLEKNMNAAGVTAADIMSTHPKTIDADELAVNALDMMRTYDITQLLVMKGDQYHGIIHLHDLIREGII